jgi:hypothetical protein
VCVWLGVVASTWVIYSVAMTARAKDINYQRY